MTNSILCETSKNAAAIQDVQLIVPDDDDDDDDGSDEDSPSIWTQYLEKFITPTSSSLTSGNGFQFHDMMNFSHSNYNAQNISPHALDWNSELSYSSSSSASSSGSTSTGISLRSREKKRKMEQDFNWATELYNFEACYNLEEYTPSLASFVIKSQFEKSNDFSRNNLFTQNLNEYTTTSVASATSAVTTTTLSSSSSSAITAATGTVMEYFDPILIDPKFHLIKDINIFGLTSLASNQQEQAGTTPSPFFDYPQDHGLLESSEFEFDNALVCSATNSNGNLPPPEEPSSYPYMKSKVGSRLKRRIEITKPSTCRSGRWSDTEDRALVMGVVEYLHGFGLEPQPPSYLPTEQELRKEGRVFGNDQDVKFQDLTTRENTPCYGWSSLPGNSNHSMNSVLPITTKDTLSFGNASITSSLVDAPNTNDFSVTSFIYKQPSSYTFEGLYLAQGQEENNNVESLFSNPLKDKENTDTNWIRQEDVKNNDNESVSINHLVPKELYESFFNGFEPMSTLITLDNYQGNKDHETEPLSLPSSCLLDQSFGLAPNPTPSLSDNSPLPMALFSYQSHSVNLGAERSNGSSNNDSGKISINGIRLNLDSLPNDNNVIQDTESCSSTSTILASASASTPTPTSEFYRALNPPTKSPLFPLPIEYQHPVPKTRQEYLLAISRAMSYCPWSFIATRMIPGRTGVQAQARWSEALDPLVKKGPWTASEDELLLRGVAQSEKCWIWIADGIPGRTQRQCRTRWVQISSRQERQAIGILGRKSGLNKKKKRNPTESRSRSRSQREGGGEGRGVRRPIVEISDTGAKSKGEEGTDSGQVLSLVIKRKLREQALLSHRNQNPEPK